MPVSMRTGTPALLSYFLQGYCRAPRCKILPGASSSGSISDLS